MLICGGLTAWLCSWIALYFLELILFVDLVDEAANVDGVLECTRLGVCAAGWPIEAPLAIKVFSARESGRCVEASSCEIRFRLTVIVVLDLAAFL
tara:strand:- start:392 stop:676 length:285 start_codon:yes stop_codon:yes gene_type:complete